MKCRRLLLLIVLLASNCVDKSPTAPSTTGLTVTGAQTGNNVQALATAHFSDGTSANVSVEAAWSSSNTNLATVSSTGLVSPGAGTGQVEIRARYQGQSAALALIVEPGRVRLP